MKNCANPDCPTKKFTPPNRRYSQQVCSRYECHVYLERKKKREWWSKHGNAWRKKWKFQRAALDKLTKPKNFWPEGLRYL